MLFLFNDKIFEIGQPEEVIRSDGFPLSEADFSRLGNQEMLSLVRMEIFANPLLVHTLPERSKQLATIIAAKTNANAILAGPPADGAKTAAQIGIMLAEVSLLTMSFLHTQQIIDALTPQEVEQSVWAELR